jgi:phospholipid transport system substrate-binding protein
MLYKFMCGILLVWNVASFSAESPQPMVESLSQQVIGVLQTHQKDLKTHPKFIEQAIRQYFIPHVDTMGMSRSVLGRQAWQTATDTDKNAFTREFTQLVLRTYAAPLANFHGEKVEFKPFKASPTPQFSQVHSTIIRPNGQRIPITYHMVLLNNREWKIYDLSVDGISLLNSFRNQFSQALRQNNLKYIIDELHQRNTKALS